MDRAGGGVVTEAEWQGFLEGEVVRRFPEGVTVLGAEVADAYKRAFGQEAVLVLESRTEREMR